MTEHLPSEERATYSIKVACNNCTYNGSLSLPRGQPFYSYQHDCPRCGCNGTLMAKRT